MPRQYCYMLACTVVPTSKIARLGGAVPLVWCTLFLRRHRTFHVEDVDLLVFSTCDQ